MKDEKKEFNYGSTKICLNGKPWTVNLVYSSNCKPYAGRSNPRVKIIEIVISQMAVNLYSEGKVCLSKEYAMHIIRHELIHALLYSTGNYDQTSRVQWGRSEVVADWFAENLETIDFNANKIYEELEIQIKKLYQDKKFEIVA